MMTLTPSIIKDIISVIGITFDPYINKYLQNDQFPDKLKIARIVPIYKCDDNKTN